MKMQGNSGRNFRVIIEEVLLEPPISLVQWRIVQQGPAQAQIYLRS